MKLSDRAVRIIRIAVLALTSLMLAVSSVLFIVSAVNINSTGDSPYSYQSIGAAFAKIQIPVYITLLLVALGGVLFTFFDNGGKARVAAPQDVGARLKRATFGLDLNSLSEKKRDEILFERRMRSGLRLANIVYFLVGTVFALLCAINPATYLDGVDSAALTGSVVRVVYATVIYLVPPMVMALLRIPINALSKEHELKLVKGLKRSRPMADACTCKKGILFSVRAALILLSVVFIILGILNGGMEDVVQKAVKICTECIGLG